MYKRQIIVLSAAIDLWAKNKSDNIFIDQEKFFNAVRVGDIKAIDLYMRAGINPHANADDRQLPIHLSKNTTNVVEVLELLRKYGLDINYIYFARRTTGPQENRFLFWATINENQALLDALLKDGADPNFETEIRGVGASFKQSLRKVAEEKAQEDNASTVSKEILKKLISSGAELSKQEKEEEVRKKPPSPEQVQACVQEMNRTPLKDWYEEASNFDHLKPSSYTIRQAILAELKTQLLIGVVSNSNAAQILAQAIRRNCLIYGRDFAK